MNRALKISLYVAAGLFVALGWPYLMALAINALGGAAP